jgi:hypothetical protein
MKKKFLNYIVVNAVSQLSLDKNADADAFTTVFLFLIQTKIFSSLFCSFHPLLVWSSFTADTNILYLMSPKLYY